MTGETHPTLFDFGPLPTDEVERTIEEQFRSFVQANPHVYREIVSMARALVAKGHRRIGIAMLWETLRYRQALQTSDASGWKLNNSYRSRMARLVMASEPDLADVFETRELRAA